MKKAKEIDFGFLETAKTTIKQRYNFIKEHDRFGLFVLINILLYWLGMWLFIFRVFGLI